jgi:hypothetical protein
MLSKYGLDFYQSLSIRGKNCMPVKLAIRTGTTGR